MTDLPRLLSLVEVRKNASSTTWYSAQLRDVVGLRAVVAFPDGVWPDREVPCTSVRACSAEAPSSFALGRGDAVEVLISASARNPCGWALGSIMAAEGDLLHVALEGAKAGMGTQVVQRNALRPVSTEAPIDPVELGRRAVLVDRALHPWLGTVDAAGCIMQIRTSAGLALAGAGTDMNGMSFSGTDAAHLEPPDAIILIGSEEAIRRGEMLVQVNLMHQREVEAFHERRRSKMQILAELRERVEGGAAREGWSQISFEVDADLIGRTLGKGAENAKRVETAHGVEIRVVDGDKNAPTRLVRILGESSDTAQLARADFELVRHPYPVDKEQVGWMLGKGGRDLNEIVDKTRLAYARFTGEDLEICGSQQSIADAVMLLDSHKEYFGVFQEMNRQRDDIAKHEEALDAAAEAAGLPSRRPRDRPLSPGRPRPAGDEAKARSKSPDRGSRGRGRGRGRGESEGDAPEPPIGKGGRGRGEGRGGARQVWKPRGTS